MLWSTPAASASISKLALSDSISARTSPLLTWSPSCFFHSRTVPSSIVSESLGILTSDIYLLLVGVPAKSQISWGGLTSDIYLLLVGVPAKSREQITGPLRPPFS